MNKVDMDGTHDCAAACLAMALGFKKASDVYPMLGYDPSTSVVTGVGDSEVLGVLYGYGKNCRYYTPVEEIAKAWNVPVEFLKDHCQLFSKAALQSRLGAMQTGCAIVGVPSLNVPDGLHFVYCERGEMHDPTPVESGRKRYNGSAKSAPVNLVIILD